MTDDDAVSLTDTTQSSNVNDLQVRIRVKGKKRSKLNNLSEARHSLIIDRGKKKSFAFHSVVM